MNIAEKINMKVPFGTMTITESAKERVNKCLESGRVTNGVLVEEFEQKFAEKMGSKYAVAVSSGTDADTLALAAMYDLGAQRGDEVIIPALTFVATANAVVNAGFTPVFVDVDRYTLNMDYDFLDRYITSRTKVIMPVHLMGKPMDMDAILQIAKNKNVNVIEDAAEAHGAEYKGRKVGTIAPFAAFSCYAAHIISSVEGGMVLTRNEYIYKVLKSLRNHGLQLKGSDWTFERIGFSSKMNELEAAVGLGNLEVMDTIIEKRRANFKYLSERFLQFQEFMYTIQEYTYEKISPHAFPIILRESCPFVKADFVRFLTEKGIDNRNLFYSIPTQTKCYGYLGWQYGAFPNAEYLSNYGTHIGIHQDLTFDQLDYVIESIKEFIKTNV